jgi:hypothetical protein
MTNFNHDTQSPPTAKPSDEALNGLFSIDNLKRRCLQMKADIKGMHMDLMKANDGRAAKELNEITSDALLDTMMLEVAYSLMLTAKKSTIAIFVEAAMLASEDGDASDLDDVLAAGNGATLGLPIKAPSSEALSDDVYDEEHEGVIPRVRYCNGMVTATIKEAPP